MNAHDELIARNAHFAATFDRGDMPALPKLGTLILTCVDARVDPAHLFDLDLGEAVVIRNNGGRVTNAAIDEILALTVLVGATTGVAQATFNIILLQHTKCGAQRLADPQLQRTLKNKFGVDASESAITDPVADLVGDIGRLANATAMPGEMNVSAMLYDVSTGTVEEVAPVKPLAAYRAV